MAMTRRFVEAVISKGWEPYIKGHSIDFRRRRSQTIITFKGHEEHEYKCSSKTAQEILNMAKEK